MSTYRDAGGTGKLLLQVHLSWDPDEDTALRIAYDQWRSGVLGLPVSWDLETVEHFDTATRHISPDVLREHVLISSDLERLTELAELGFDELYLHHVGQEQRAFVDAFGARVLPKLDVTPPAR